MRMSEPRVRIVFVIDSTLIYTPYLPCRQQVETSNTGPILAFARIQPFGSEKFSSLGKVFSRQATESVNCENSSVSFVMKYCAITTTFKNPAPIQNMLNLSCCDNFSIRSPYLCKKIFLCRIISIQKHVCHDHTWHKRGTRLSSHNGFLRSIMKGFIFFTHFCDCSVKTEQIYRLIGQTTVVIVSWSAHQRIDNFPPPLLCLTDLWTMDSWLEGLGVRFLRVSPSSFPPFCPIHLVDYLHW